MGLLQKIGALGIEKEHSAYDQKIRRFFNLMNFFGGISAIPQAAMIFPHDRIAGMMHVSWGMCVFFSLFIHAKIGFKPARFVTFLSVLLLGHIASMRIGPEALPHVASFGIMVACFVMHDFKKEWAYLAFFLAIEVAGLILTESQIFQVTTIDPDFAYTNRIVTLCGTLVFVVFETLFFVQLSNANETNYIKRLETNNSDLESANLEKSVLLREVHHRVKNNLQLISSLLRLQAEKSRNSDLETHFADATSRIKSIALLHEKVYQNESLAEINFEEYLHSIGNDMILSHGNERETVFRVSSDLRNINNESLVPLALIVNELISNSLKHGLKDIRNGSISVNITKVDDSEFKLTYSDGGQWVEPANDDSFGMELMETLVEQLSGEFKMELVNNSPTFHVSFKLEC